MSSRRLYGVLCNTFDIVGPMLLHWDDELDSYWDIGGNIDFKKVGLNNDCIDCIRFVGSKKECELLVLGAKSVLGILRSNLVNRGFDLNAERDIKEIIE